MFSEIINDPVASVFGLGASVTGLIYFARWARRIYFSEKRDTSIDLASQSLFENLRLENKRMSEQMAMLSNQLYELAKENRDLHNKVSELNTSINRLVKLEKENKKLQNELIRKDDEIYNLSERVNECLEAIKLRHVARD